MRSPTPVVLAVITVAVITKVAVADAIVTILSGNTEGKPRNNEKGSILRDGNNISIGTDGKHGFPKGNFDVSVSAQI